MNVDLLESVRQSILFEPGRFCAAQWAFARNEDRVFREGATPEGFQCCIAGHVLLRSGRLSERQLLLEGGFHTGGRLWEQAAAALGVDGEQCRELFFPSQWDQPYKRAYYLCERAEEAEVVADYLDYFMTKYGVSGSGADSLGADRSSRASKPRSEAARRGAISAAGRIG